MLALTLWPEWAHAIAHLGKDIENRYWRPKWGLAPGDEFLIHAGAHIGGRKGKVAKREGVEALAYAAELAKFSNIRAGFDPSAPDEINFATDGMARRIDRGAFVAVVRYLGYVTESDSIWFTGPIGWRLELVERLDPAPTYSPGAQGLWHAPDLTELRATRDLKSRAGGGDHV